MDKAKLADNVKLNLLYFFDAERLLEKVDKKRQCNIFIKDRVCSNCLRAFRRPFGLKRHLRRCSSQLLQSRMAKAVKKVKIKAKRTNKRRKPSVVAITLTDESDEKTLITSEEEEADLTLIDEEEEDVAHCVSEYDLSDDYQFDQEEFEEGDNLTNDVGRNQEVTSNDVGNDKIQTFDQDTAKHLSEMMAFQPRVRLLRETFSREAQSNSQHDSSKIEKVKSEPVVELPDLDLSNREEVIFLSSDSE